MQASQTVGVITLEPSAENESCFGNDLTLQSTFHRLVATSEFDCDYSDFDRIGINRIFERFEPAPSETVVYADVHELASELLEEFESLRQHIDL